MIKKATSKTPLADIRAVKLRIEKGMTTKQTAKETGFDINYVVSILDRNTIGANRLRAAYFSDIEELELSGSLNKTSKKDLYKNIQVKTEENSKLVDDLKNIKQAVKKCFPSLISCDDVLLVKVDSYNELVKLLNS
jgi:hypothetical protein